MCDEEDEQLILYLLGELSYAERASIEERLEQGEPGLKERIDRLRRCLEANHQAIKPGVCSQETPAEPIPRQLADRTAHAVLAAKNCVDPCVGRKRFSLCEVVAIGAAAMLIGALVVPAIQSSRAEARRAICAENLHEIYRSLALYSEEHGNRFPEIGAGENAGLFTVALADGGFIERERLQQLLVCPSSELSTAVRAGTLRVIVPTREDLLAAHNELAAQLRRFMAGGLAYRIGHLENGVYVTAKPHMSCRIALLAEAPARDGDGMVLSRNHGECAQNVLFEDGHVQFVTGCWTPGSDRDHLFLNNAGQVAAGHGSADIVLAPSEATPGVVKLVPVGF